MIGDVTLSFDNGPSAEVTESVLDVLARHTVAASFFVLGGQIADPALRALARRAAGAGHWIGNHTYTHTVPLGLTDDPATPEREIARTEALIGALAQAPPLFRPFGGGGRLGPHLLSRAAADHLQARGYTCVLWNAIPRDWADPDGWVETALAQCRALPWSLVVLHDTPTGAMARLEDFIVRASAEGARFRHDFPPECLPMVAGRSGAALAACVADRRALER